MTMVEDKNIQTTTQQIAASADATKQWLIRNHATQQDMDVQDAMDRYYWDSANRGVAEVYDYMQDPGYSSENLSNMLRADKFRDTRYRYGSTDDIIRAAQNYGAYQTAQREDKEAAARAAVEARNAAPLSYTRGDVSVEIPRAFTDFIKSKDEELALAQTDEERNRIYQQVADELGKITGTPAYTAADGMMKSWNDLYARYGEDMANRVIINDILREARGRQDEVYTPEPQDTRSFYERLRDREARQALIDKEKEQRRIERARLGHGIAGLAATIGDMVRASEGAPVSQRDWQRIYDNLNAQERANVNNYQVRLAKLNEDARQERLIEAQRRAQQAMKAAEMQQAYNLKAAELERSGKNAELRANATVAAAEKNAAGRVEAARETGESREEAARITAGSKKPSTQPTKLGSETWLLPNEASMKKFVYSVIEVLNNPKSYKTGKEHKVTLLAEQTINNDPYGYYDRNVESIVSNYWNDLTQVARSEIKKRVRSYGGALSPSDNYVSKKDDYEPKSTSGTNTNAMDLFQSKWGVNLSKNKE